MLHWGVYLGGHFRMSVFSSVFLAESDGKRLQEG